MQAILRSKMMIDERPLRGHIPARNHLAHLARDNPDWGTYKAGYRVEGGKKLSLSPILRGRNPRAKIDIARYPLTSRQTTTMTVYYRRVINRRHPVIGSRYTFTVQASPRPSGSEHCFIKGGEKRAIVVGSCSCRRGQGRLPRRRRRAPRSRRSGPAAGS